MRTTYSETASSTSLVVVARSLAGALGAVLSLFDPGMTRLSDQLLTWQQRARDRRSLQRLDAHMLHDIGLSAADVDREASKPFWRS